MGSHLGCSIIPGGIPSGIPLKKGGIPPGTHLGSQLGLAGSHLTFLPGIYKWNITQLKKYNEEDKPVEAETHLHNQETVEAEPNVECREEK